MPTITAQTYNTGFLPTWCPGCGDYGIWTALKSALANMNIGSDDGLIVYGIGCHGNMYNVMKTYGVEGLHGRTLPLAQGAKIANHKLPVIVVSGDGDCLGEGGNHFLHAAKRNPDVTVVLHDNQVYGLTTGQASPTAQIGFKTKSTPEGATDTPVNPLVLALAAGASFVARGFAGDTPGLTALLEEAVKHKGFSVVDILQPCVTFDKVHTYGWYRQRLYKLEDAYKADNRLKAMERAMEWGEKIPVGIFFKEERPTSEEREPALEHRPLVDVPMATSEVFEEILKEFI